ncbi:MAG: right-handed parallel beta-helix repeat-containing protein, partial [Planctomycetes bacterium]|nr:right-handed parallel beta-helix repeat-containing protein [Planctomycetota bacterium]
MRKKTNLKKWVVVCIFIFTTAGSIAVADTIYVDDNAPGGGNGSSWNLAYQSLQDALSDASSGDQIYVAQGTYKPTTETTRTISFELKTGVELYGGYAGYGTDNPNERDIELYETILSGDIDTVDDDSDNSYHVVVGSGTDSTAVLDGFTITGGNADHTSWPHDVGGGMYNNDGSPTVSNCTFSENIADDRGGGMANYGGSGPIVTNCSFLTNESDDLGGGIHNSTGSNITITDCIFTENTALNGGGVSNYISHPSITECTFSDNSAVYRGGGVYNDDSDPNVTGCTFSDNSATDTTDGRGGAMANYEASTPTVTDCNFLNNTSGDLGGGIHNSTGGDAIITDCIFTGNTARRGGGISNFECSPSITRCTFSANVVSKNGLVDQAQGGGIRNSTSAHAEISDCIFMGNTAERGGGISNWDNCNPNISNCMFTDNEGINFGGGLYNLDNCDPTISNCTFTGNKAYHGGGISSWEYCNLTITNCTFSGNFAQETNGDGGGISNFWHVDSTITNCTFSGNIAGQGGGIFNEDFSNSTIDNCILWGNSTEIKNVDSSTSTVNYSCIEGGHAGTGNIIDNPLFVEANGPDNIYGTKD